MTAERLNRVVWRLEEMKPFIEPDIYSNHQVDVAIMEECGSSDRTLRDTKKQMRKLGLLASNGLGTWIANIKKSKNFRAEAEYGEQIQLGTNDRVPTA